MNGFLFLCYVLFSPVVFKSCSFSKDFFFWFSLTLDLLIFCLFFLFASMVGEGSQIVHCIKKKDILGHQVYAYFFINA